MTTDGGNRWGTVARCGPLRHIPVLLPEVLAALQPRGGAHYIDGTFGGGGYTRAILEAADCRVTALDRDPQAIRDGQCMADALPGRLQLVQACFGDLADGIPELGDELFDGVVLDIGVSSMHLDQAERGFSFQADGPLDMRMGAEGGIDWGGRPSAADLVNTLEAGPLADIIYQLGEERRSRQIASAIVRAREAGPIERTVQLANIVARAYGRPPKDGRHPATRTFQALRIAVNDELGELGRGLEGAERVLKPGGRLVVVTFHSLEDRVVKRFFTERAGRMGGGSRHRPELNQFDPQTFRNVNQRPLTPGNEEIAANPRARSAKLRFGERTEEPSRPIAPQSLGIPDVDLG
ncbi:MAG TPA: 16S rRNA (cytosine(1402)-N(4))-methyltransferase RsmH [Hyphomicrobiaceae bacterium]|nr:16S rRNA (cytosine(1402)-N(4))-methyltransferase RsmH [Hyphomicrobiaceae bacterium]